MKPEKPILFSGPMVRAILDGRKTQTRRIVKLQPTDGGNISKSADGRFLVEHWPKQGRSMGNFGRSALISSPYGAPGYRLWVKETHWRLGKWVRNGVTKTGRQKWRFRAESNAPSSVCFEAPHAKPARTLVGWHKRPSIFMPRWASRITIEITAVRVERLQDISEEDAKAEGAERDWTPEEDDTWMWVVEFKRIQP